MAAIRYYDWIAHHAGHQPGKLAVRELESGRAFSYAELHQRCGRLASALAALGVARGDRVAILAQNGVETFELQFAAARLGAIVLPLNWRLTVPELSYIIGDSTPSVLVHDVEFADTALALHRECGIRTLLSLNHRAPNEGGYEQALAEAQTMVALPPEDVMHDDLAMIMYTSGTTGHPKGAMITHGMVFWNCVNLGVPAAITPRTVQLVVLPLFHTGGLNCYANPVLHAGGSLVIQRAFDPGAALAAIGDRSLGITHFFAVPAPYQFMMQHPDFPGTDLSRLEVAGVGGAPCPLAVLEQWQARHVPLVQGYGMTETSPGVAMLGADDAARKVGSAGKALLHAEVRIVDADGHDVGPNQMGELWTRGPHITPGYWNKPEATEAAFEGRWLKTGDAAQFDDEGFIYIVDRWKDMYISGGENVYPAEVENVIYQLPQIAEAAVIGVGDERWGEVGKAVIVLKADQVLAADTLIGHCAQRLAKYKVPRSVEFMDALPRNATGKVLKRELRKQFDPAA